jgi:hypothetical protein
MAIRQARTRATRRARALGGSWVGVTARPMHTVAAGRARTTMDGWAHGSGLVVLLCGSEWCMLPEMEKTTNTNKVIEM